jgi:hypothetical protein
MCGTVAWLSGNTYRDDEQFDLAAWVSFTQIQSWSRVASFYIFLYLGSVNSAGSFTRVVVISAISISSCKVTTFFGKKMKARKKFINNLKLNTLQPCSVIES